MKIKTLLIATLLFCGISLFGQLGNSLDLNTAGIIPLTDPYDGLETVTTIPANACDWVKVVLRTGTAGTTAVDSAYGFILFDGSIVASDGVSDLAFENAAPGSYYAVVYHRNHLGIMSASAVDISSGSATYDFTTGTGQAYGNDLASLGGGVYGMYSGNMDNTDQEIDADDVNIGWLPFFGLNTYLAADADLNADVNSDDVNNEWLPNFGYSSNVPN